MNSSKYLNQKLHQVFTNFHLLPPTYSHSGRQFGSVLWIKNLPLSPELTQLGTSVNRLKTYIHGEIPTQMFTARLFTIAKRWERLRCPSICKRIDSCATPIKWNTIQRFKKTKQNKPLTHAAGMRVKAFGKWKKPDPKSYILCDSKIHDILEEARLQGRKTVVAGAGEGAVSTNQMHKERFKDHQRSHINAVWCPEANSRTLLEKLEIWGESAVTSDVSVLASPIWQTLLQYCKTSTWEMGIWHDSGDTVGMTPPHIWMPRVKSCSSLHSSSLLRHTRIQFHPGSWL